MENNLLCGGTIQFIWHFVAARFELSFRVFDFFWQPQKCNINTQRICIDCNIVYADVDPTSFFIRDRGWGAFTEVWRRKASREIVGTVCFYTIQRYRQLLNEIILITTICSLRLRLYCGWTATVFKLLSLWNKKTNSNGRTCCFSRNVKCYIVCHELPCVMLERFSDYSG